MSGRWSRLRPAADVESQLFGALAVLRLVVLLNAVGLNAYRDDTFEHRVLGWSAVVVMIGWSVAAGVAYAAPARRTPWLLGLDLAVAVGLMAISPVVKGDGFAATVPGFWVMASLLAWAVHWKVAGGLVAGVVLAATDLVVRAEASQATYGNVFLLLIGGPIVGYMCASLERMSRERDAAVRASAADAERVRLARAVHDGVLQVLALVQRRGADLGPDGAQLARLAGEQEASLRALIREQDAVAEHRAHGLDLAAALARLGRRRGVTVATPGPAVLVSNAIGTEVVAVVGACLDNVAVHVGAGAPAWVLLEDLGDRVEVSVRDQGPGIAPGRLEEAYGEGRLGVAQSIRGRIGDLGGEAVLDSGPHGTEWQLSVPVRPGASR